MQTRIIVGLSLLLVVMYSLAHAVWVYDHPPLLNDDHFHTEIVLSQLANPALYPDDLAWSSQEFAKSHGFLFINALKLSQALFGGYQEAWAYLSFVLVLLYIPGFYLFIYEIIEPESTSKRIRKPIADPDDEEVIDMRRHWLALTLAIGSTMPLYLYVSFANWGITSVYAHVFVTSLCGWVLWGFVKSLKRDASVRRWFAFAVAVTFTIYLNPVNGGGLVGILSLMLLVETLSGRVTWRKWGGFMAGVLVVMLPFLLNYGGTQLERPDTRSEIEAAQEFILKLYSRRVYPWNLNADLAPALLLVVGVTGLLGLWLYIRTTSPSRSWVFVLAAIQLGMGYLFIGQPIFLLVAAYWWFHPPFNRWDRLFLVMVTAVNFIAPITSALSHGLWVEGNLFPAFSLTYETIRLETYIILPLYAFLARWMYQLVQDDAGDSDWLNWIIALLMLGTIFSIFGSANPVKDDGILMKTFLPIRWGMPLLALGLLWLKEQGRMSSQLNQAAWVIFLLAGIGFVVGMKALSGIAPMGTLVLFILLLTLAFGLQHISLNIAPAKMLPIAALVLFFLGTVILPIAGYHKNKRDVNFCDIGEPSLNRALLDNDHIIQQNNVVFEAHCVEKSSVQQAAEWVKEATPLDSYIFVAGLQPERFQPMAQRSTVHVNYGQIYWFHGARALLDAVELDQSLMGANPLRPDYLGDAPLFDLLTSLGVDYVAIVGNHYTFDLPVAYQNNQVTIYAYQP